jgi:DNA-binding NarL/FixJ family response regulator
VKRARLLLADSQTLFLEGLRRVLARAFDVIGVAEDGRVLLRVAQELQPDVILLDFDLAGIDGERAARQLRKTLPGAKIIFLTAQADADSVAAALRTGAAGYLLKRSSVEELLNAIRQVLSGICYVTPWAGPVGSGNSRERETPQRRSQIGNLTRREREVLRLVASGSSIKEIAAALRISTKTVEFHKARIANKLGIRGTAGLTKYAINEGLLP